MNAHTRDLIFDGLVAALTPARDQMVSVADETTGIEVGRLYISPGIVRWTVSGSAVKGSAETVETATEELRDAAKTEINAAGSYLAWRLEQYREKQAIEALPEPERGLRRQLRQARVELMRAEHRNILIPGEAPGLTAEIARIEAELAGLRVEEAA